MPGPQPRLHLPYDQWPPADRLLWERAFCNDDPFAEAAGAAWPKPRRIAVCGRGDGSSDSWQSMSPTALEIAPTERLTIERVRPFVAHLAETNAPQIGREPY